MKFQFKSSGYGMYPESSQFRLFNVLPFFEADNGAGGSGGGGTPPEPPPTPTPTPTPTPAPAEDVSGLKSALEKERSQSKEWERQFKQLQEQVKDIDPTKYAQLEALQKQAEEWNQKEIKIRQELETQYTTQIQEEQKKTTQVMQQLLDLTKRTQAEKAFQGAKGRSGAGDDGITFFDSFLAIAGGNIKLNDKGHLEVLDGNGVRMFSKKDASKPMTAQEYFESLHTHPVLGWYFAANDRMKGSGMPPGSGSNVTLAGQDLSSLPRAERLRILREKAS